MCEPVLFVMSVSVRRLRSKLLAEHRENVYDEGISFIKAEKLQFIIEDVVYFFSCTS